jgi:hypothetical protein
MGIKIKTLIIAVLNNNKATISNRSIALQVYGLNNNYTLGTLENYVSRVRSEIRAAESTNKLSLISVLNNAISKFMAYFFKKENVSIV